MDIGRLSDTYRCETSFNGYSLDELKSALQKYIRRSDPVNAIYAGIELDLFALIGAEGIRTNFIHRLMVIFLEDVGNVDMWPWVDSMVFELLSLRLRRQKFPDRFESVRKEEMSIVPRVINALATSSHSRENSFYNFVFRTYFSLDSLTKDRIRHRFPVMNDIELSVQRSFPTTIAFTAQLDEDQLAICRNFLGCIQTRDETALYFAHKISEFPKLHQKFFKSTKPAFLIFHLVELALGPEICPVLEIAVRWFRELSPLQEEYLCWHQLVLFIVKRSPLQTFEEDQKNVPRIHLMYKRNLRKAILQFDDFVYDMHTRQGKAARRGSSHFALVSSAVTNEDPDVKIAYKNIYTFYKTITDTAQPHVEPTLESMYFDFHVRAQLVTGNGKTDTYFATRPDGSLVFVKGPLDSNATAEKFMRIQLLKKRMGLHTLDYEVVHLRPDLFPDSPLGLRNRLDRNRHYPFIMCQTVFDLTPGTIPRRLHSSKIWPPTEVIDWSSIRTSSHLDAASLTDELLMQEYVQNVVFRYVFGIGDMAKRNFLVHNGHILSIDEDSSDRDFSLVSNMTDLYKPFLNFVQGNKEWFAHVLQKYKKYRNHRLEFLENL